MSLFSDSYSRIPASVDRLSGIRPTPLEKSASMMNDASKNNETRFLL